MPKKNHYPHPTPNQVNGSDTRLEIGWQDGQVTFATTKLLPGAARDADFVPAPTSPVLLAPAALGGDLLVAADRPDAPHVEAWQGIRVAFSDRGEVNEMIRSLREARDRAFGRDE